MSQKSKIDWASIPDLGKVPDDVIAERLGVHVSTVAKQRQMLGIERSRIKIDWASIPDLGKVPDDVIAHRLGVSQSTVNRERRMLGLPAVERVKIDWASVDDLGKVPDHIIAQRLGVSATLVLQQRRRRGLAAPPSSPRQSTQGTPPPARPSDRAAEVGRLLRSGVAPTDVAAATGAVLAYVIGVAESLGIDVVAPGETRRYVIVAAPRRRPGSTRTITVEPPLWWGRSAVAVDVRWDDGKAVMVPIAGNDPAQSPVDAPPGAGNEAPVGAIPP